MWLNCPRVKMTTPNHYGYVKIYDDKFYFSSCGHNIDTPSYKELLNTFHELQDDMFSLCIKNWAYRKTRSLIKGIKSFESRKRKKKNYLLWSLKVSNMRMKACPASQWFGCYHFKIYKRTKIVRIITWKSEASFWQTWYWFCGK